MSLSRALNSSQTGLYISQTGLATVGHNIANADTEGYSRQRVEIAAHDPVRLGSSYIGQGARVQGITRAEDRFMELQVIRDMTLQGFYESRDLTLDAVERLYLESTEPTIGGAIDGFFNAARELSQDPENNAARSSFVGAAQSVAQAFNVLDADLRRVQAGLDDDLTDTLQQVNDLGEQIAVLNARIVSMEVDGQYANDLRDQRDRAIRDLSGLVDVNPMPQRDGSVTVQIANAYTLVQGDVSARLEGTPNAANQGLLDVEWVGMNGQRANITGALNEGEIGGLLDVRDRVIGTDLEELDQLAFTFAEQINIQHRAGFGLDGVGGRDLFVPLPGVPFSAANVAVDAAVAGDLDQVAAAGAAGAAGDNRNALELADLQLIDQLALGDVSFNRRFAEVLHGVGYAAADNSRRLEMHDVRVEQSSALLESVEGVNIDDEMLDLTRYQKHFEANARVITTIGQLLDTVMSLIR